MTAAKPVVPITSKSGPVPLETELSAALNHIHSARNRQLVARHLGWDGGPPCSLKEAGERYSLTRERARQVYAIALPVLRQSQTMPALDAVLTVPIGDPRIMQFALKYTF